MKVIRHGDPDKVDPIYQGTCTRCNCVMECRLSELENVRQIHTGECKIGSYVCPDCKNWTTFYPINFRAMPSSGYKD